MEKENTWIRGTNAERKFNLRFKRHESHLIETLRQHWENKLFFDVTLACQQGSLGAHRIVLCTFSTLLEQILTSSNRVADRQEQPCIVLNRHPSLNPVIYFESIDLNDLTTLVEFMYRGTLTVTHRKLPGLMRAATILKIRQPESDSGNTVLELGTRTRLPENITSTQNPSFENSPSVRVQSTVSSNQPKNTDNQSTSMEEEASGKRTDYCPFLTTCKTNVRPRIVWNKRQIRYLENIFNGGVCYPDLEQCQMYAEELSQIPKSEAETYYFTANTSRYVDVSYMNVRNWFQNKRYQSRHSAKMKKNKRNAETEDENAADIEVD